tara:strand:+ start:907 stop:1539 length:633 start_codon:yes stop_codon:yes gene_type:complete
MFATKLNNYNNNNIVLCDPIKNSIIQHSNFYKLLYSDETISINGIYLLFNINNSTLYKDKISYNKDSNIEIIKNITELEDYLLNKLDNSKKKINKLQDLFNNCNIKYSLSDNYINLRQNNNDNENSYDNYINNFDTNSNNDNIINDINSNLYNTSKNIINIKNSNNTHSFILKISGIWETKDNVGLTFKIILINKFIEFYPSVEKNANNI